MSHGLGQMFGVGAGSRGPSREKKPGVFGAHAFFVLGTVPIKKKRLQVKPKANKLYKEALEQCNHNNHVSKFI